jgi:hypothetical protein
MANVVEAIWNLLFKEGEQAKYQENPQEYLQETGLDECDPTELYEAVVMAYEKGPVYQGASVNVGGNQGVGGSSQSAGGAGSAAPGPASAPPPPPPLDPTLPPAEALEQTINYYVTNTTTTNVDDRDTNVDSSQNVFVGEDANIGSIDLDNETVTASGDGAVAAGEDVYGAATGDGAVAAGDDINAPVNTGTVEDSILADESTFDDTVIGDDNQVIQDSTNAAIGGDVSDDDVNVDIDASGSNVNLENVNFGQDNVIDDSEQYTDSFNTTDSFNQDNDFTTETTDSFNTDASTTTVDDSYNEQSQVGDDSFDNQYVEESFNQPPAEEAAAAPEPPADDPADI